MTRFTSCFLKVHTQHCTTLSCQQDLPYLDVFPLAFLLFLSPRLLPTTSKFNTLLNTSLTSLLKTCPYHHTQPAPACPSKVSSNPNKSMFLAISFPNQIKSTNCLHHCIFSFQNCHFTLFQTPCLASIPHCQPYTTPDTFILLILLKPCLLLQFPHWYLNYCLSYKNSLQTPFGHKMIILHLVPHFFLGSGYFAVDGNLPSETILP